MRLFLATSEFIVITFELNAFPVRKASWCSAIKSRACFAVVSLGIFNRKSPFNRHASRMVFIKDPSHKICDHVWDTRRHWKTWRRFRCWTTNWANSAGKLPTISKRNSVSPIRALSSRTCCLEIAPYKQWSLVQID